MYGISSSTHLFSILRKFPPPNLVNFLPFFIRVIVFFLQFTDFQTFHNLPKKLLVFQVPVLENGRRKFHDCQGFQGPVRTPLSFAEAHMGFWYGENPLSEVSAGAGKPPVTCARTHHVQWISPETPLSLCRRENEPCNTCTCHCLNDASDLL